MGSTLTLQKLKSNPKDYEPQLSKYNLINQYKHIQNQLTSKYSIIKYWKNQQQNQTLLQQQFTTYSKSHLYNILNSFIFRYNNEFLVSTKYIITQRISQQITHVRIFYQNVITSLNHFKQIPLKDAPYFINDTLKGFSLLIKKYGNFKIQQGMINITENRKVKIWTNQIIFNLNIEKNQITSQKKMVETILKIFKENIYFNHLNHSQNNETKSFSEFIYKSIDYINNSKTSTFQEAIKKFQQILSQNNIQSKNQQLKCFEKFSYEQLLKLKKNYDQNFKKNTNKSKQLITQFSELTVSFSNKKIDEKGTYIAQNKLNQVSRSFSTTTQRKKGVSLVKNQTQTHIKQTCSSIQKNNKINFSFIKNQSSQKVLNLRPRRNNSQSFLSIQKSNCHLKIMPLPSNKPVLKLGPSNSLKRISIGNKIMIQKNGTSKLKINPSTPPLKMFQNQLQLKNRVNSSFTNNFNQNNHSRNNSQGNFYKSENQFSSNQQKLNKNNYRINFMTGLTYFPMEQNFVIPKTYIYGTKQNKQSLKTNRSCLESSRSRFQCNLLNNQLYKSIKEQSNQSTDRIDCSESQRKLKKSYYQFNRSDLFTDPKLYQYITNDLIKKRSSLQYKAYCNEFKNKDKNQLNFDKFIQQGPISESVNCVEQNTINQSQKDLKTNIYLLPINSSSQLINLNTIDEKKNIFTKDKEKKKIGWKNLEINDLEVQEQQNTKKNEQQGIDYFNQQNSIKNRQYDESVVMEYKKFQQDKINYPFKIVSNVQQISNRNKNDFKKTSVRHFNSPSSPVHQLNNISSNQYLRINNQNQESFLQNIKPKLNPILMKDLQKVRKNNFL